MKFFITLAVLSLLLLSTATAQDAAYRFKPGRQYNYLLEEASTSIQEIQGRVMTSSSEKTLSLTLEVNKVLDDGNMDMTMTANSALIINESPQGTQTSGEKLAGNSVDFTLSDDGEVVAVDTAKLEQQDLDELGQSLLISFANSVFPRLKAENLEVGGSWERVESDTTFRGGGEIFKETESEYTVDRKEELNGFDCLVIKVEANVDIEGSMVQGGQDIQIIGGMEAEGEIYYAPEEGILVKFETEIVGDQTLVVSSANMRIPISSNSTLTIELLTE